VAKKIILRKTGQVVRIPREIEKETGPHVPPPVGNRSE
jgi:hypothetical protein